MNKPSKFLVAGIVTAAVCFGAGHLLIMRLHSGVESLVAACQVESVRGQQSNSELAWKKSPLVCEPEELASFETQVGIQAQIVAAHKALIFYSVWPLFAAILVLVVSVAPFLWYFLLQRIRELREAVVGK